MVIGRRPKYAKRAELNKWYFGIEINKCPGFMYGVIKPSILVWFFKVLEYPEPGKLDSPGKQIGGWRRFHCPIGIRIEIIK